jgi:hypothetical protein
MQKHQTTANVENGGCMSRSTSTRAPRREYHDAGPQLRKNFGVHSNVNATLDPTLILGEQVADDADHLNSGQCFAIQGPVSLLKP